MEEGLLVGRKPIHDLSGILANKESSRSRDRTHQCVGQGRLRLEPPWPGVLLNFWICGFSLPPGTEDEEDLDCTGTEMQCGLALGGAPLR
jgi:hypothetical protein